MKVTTIDHGGRFAPGDVLRHFKRDRPGVSGTEYLYRYVGTASHTETGEKFAVYRALYGECLLYVRPAEAFFSPVDRRKHPDAVQEYRFEPASPEEAALAGGVQC